MKTLCVTVMLSCLVFQMGAQGAVGTAVSESKGPDLPGSLRTALEQHVLRLGIDPKGKIAEQELRFAPRFHANVLETTYADRTIVVVDADNRRLLAYYSLSSLGGKLPEPFKKEDAIKKEVALEKALAFLRLHGYKIEDMSEFQAKYVDIGGRTVWYVLKQHKHQGIECYNKAIGLYVCAHSGKIISFSDIPVVVPKSMKQNVSREQAFKVAKGLVDDRFAGTALELDRGSKLGIVQANKWWTSKKKEFLQGDFVLCWVVKFDGAKRAKGDRPFVWVYVDCASGEIVGGLQRGMRQPRDRPTQSSQS